MGKQKRVNWILVITGVLLLVSVGVFAYQFLLEKKPSVCNFEGGTIEYGVEIVSSTGANCVCLQTGKMDCEDVVQDETEESFSTENLEFEYSYLNTITESSSDLSRVQLANVSQKGKKLVVVLERETLCNEDFEAASQAGYYEKYDNRLILSTITSSDEEKFNIPCLVSNTFTISDFHSEDDDFEIFYRNEKGKEFNLLICSYNGKLYGEGDVFSGGENKSICSCKESKVVCE